MALCLSKQSSNEPESVYLTGSSFEKSPNYYWGFFCL